MSMNRRVVVTGMGAVTCVGNDVATFWDALVNGRSGIGAITAFDATRFRTRIAGEVKGFDITKYMPTKEARRLDLFCQFAIAAADEAMADAGIPQDLSGFDTEKIGVLVGSGIGGIKTLEEQCNVLNTKGPERSSPLLVPMMIVDMASGAISMRYGARGPNMSIVTACATSTHSIGESLWMIKRGDADIMITGGAEASISPLGFAGFCSMRAMSQHNDEPTKASRPFDANRDGFVMAEGSGVLILEELEHAKSRGATILAELCGYGATADAHHITAPAPGGEGAARAMRMALRHAKLQPEQIDYFNAHGTSTDLNDKYETAAIKAVFGERARKMHISSVKGTMGHALGATGALETIACVKALSQGIVPPTINYETPDPECDLDYTPNTARKATLTNALNINLGFGGHNAALILSKFQ